MDTSEEILQEAKAITEFKGMDLSQCLYREILLNALKAKRDGLGESFADLLESGEIEKSGPLRQENDGPELLSKQRISFRNDKQSAGLPNEMILELNLMGNAA